MHRLSRAFRRGFGGGPTNAPSEIAGSSTTPTLEPLEPLVAATKDAGNSPSSPPNDRDDIVHIKRETHEDVALIKVCGHLLHDSRLKEWTEKANSCPICRQVFHLVHVYDKIGGEPSLGTLCSEEDLSLTGEYLTDRI